jgi:hypothetical protein
VKRVLEKQVLEKQVLEKRVLEKRVLEKRVPEMVVPAELLPWVFCISVGSTRNSLGRLKRADRVAVRRI